MRALCYIIVTSLKNRLLALLRKPAQLVLYLLCIAGVVFLFVLPKITNPQGTPQMDIIWLKGAYFAFIVLFFVNSVRKGLSNGDLIFEMQDVNFLFVSPISAKSILFYGLAQMAKMAFWAGFFILFQGSTLGNMFGKGGGAVLILFLNFIFIVVLLSILSLVLYNLTAGRPKRKRLVRMLAVATFLPVAANFGLQLLRSGDLVAALTKTMQSPVFSWTPVAGWGAESAVALINGQIQIGILFIGVIVVAGAALVAYLLLGNIDYYEDILVATETAFERKRAIAEGQLNQEALSKTKIKVAKTGIGGFGASAFLHKHLRETTRANPLGLLSRTALYMTLGGALFAFFLRNEGIAGLVILQILMWTQIFLIGTGRGMKELSFHYIYLIPESSFRKIVWSNMEPVVSILLESCLIFGVSGLISGDSFFVILGCIFVFTLFSTMLIAVNFLSMRWIGTDMSAGILIIIYLATVLLLLAPGLAAAIVIAVSLAGTAGAFIGLSVLSLWELLVSIVCFACAKGIIHHCDIQVIKQ